MFTQNLVICNFYPSLDILKTKNQKQMVKTTLALLGLAKADHCNFDDNAYTSADCSGTATVTINTANVVLDECVESGENSVKYSECSSTQLKYDAWLGSKDCSGTAVALTEKVGVCEVTSTGSKKTTQKDGAATTAIAWASFALTIIAAHI